MTISELCIGRWAEILPNFIDPTIINGKHQPCPMCGGKDRFRYTNHDDRGMYICNACGSGSGIDLLIGVTGKTFHEVAKDIEQLLNVKGESMTTKSVDERQRLKKIARTSKRLTVGDQAHTYLKNRGLALDKMPMNLRTGPVDYWAKDGDGFKRLGTFTSMIATVQNETGDNVTLHVTYLDNGEKANVPSPKKIAAPGTGAVRLYKAEKHLGIAEGIETAIAAYELTNIPTWAALNTAGLKKFRPPEGVKSITIFFDNDVNFAGHAAAYELAHTLVAKYDVDLFGPERVGWDMLDLKKESAA